MVAIKLAAFSLLLSAASSLPTEQLEDRAVHKGDWLCTNTQYKNGLAFTSAQVQAALKNAPTTGGASGYPHKFNNGYDEKTHKKVPGYDIINFDSKPCNKVPTDKTYLLEFPILEGGRLYDANGKPKPAPEAARVIYYVPDKILCGVVAHTDGSKGPIKLCAKQK